MFKASIPPSGASPRRAGASGEASAAAAQEKAGASKAERSSSLRYSPRMDFVPGGGPRTSAGPAPGTRNPPPAARGSESQASRASDLNPRAEPFVPASVGSPAAGRAAAHTGSRPPQAEAADFFAAQADLRRLIEAAPPFPDKEEALFICDELTRYPCYPEEKLCVRRDRAGLPNGLLKLGAPVRMETFGSPAHVTMQQIVTFPPRQGAGTALTTQAVNHSQAQHCGGNVRASHNIGSEGFYERMGFEQVGPHWLLQPSKRPDLWERTPSDQWRFKG